MLSIGLGVAGCSHQPTPAEVRVVTKTIERQLPKINAPPVVTLAPVKWDYVRGEQDVIRNITRCQQVPEANRNTAEFKKSCTIKGIQENSNIFIGMDEQSFKNLQKNVQALEARDRQWQARVNAANKLSGNDPAPKAAPVAKPPAKKGVVRRVKEAISPTPTPPANGGPPRRKQ